MSGFSVWYVMVIVFADNSGLHSAASPKVDLAECQRDAMRTMAALPQGTAKWACHEMTIEVKGQNVLVTFPEN